LAVAKKSKTVSHDIWTQALVDIGEDMTDDQSAQTIHELALLWNVSHQTVEGRIIKLLDAGRAVQTRKRGLRGSVRAFRLKGIK
jgi:hypothetical protein